MITLNVMFNWYTCSIMFYALSLNAAALPLSPYWNGFAVNLVEIPAYCFFFLEKCCPSLLKRRTLMFWSLLVSGVCCIISTIFAEISFCQKDAEDKFSNPWIIGGFLLALIGKMAVAISFALIYLYTAELFPTSVRCNAVGLGSLSARFGGMCTPIVLALYGLRSWLPGATLSILAICAGCTSLYFPETYGKSSPMTFDEANRLYKGLDY